MSHQRPDGQRVRFVTKRWAHHSTHSGYDRLAAYIGSAIPPIDMARLSSRWIPERIAARFCRRSGVWGYYTPSFYAEWSAAREMLVQPWKTIYHLLYGDDTYRYLGSVRRMRGHRLVVSYHVPPDDLASRIRHVGHLRQVDAIVVVATNQVPFFADICGHDRVHVVPHGVDTEVFAPSPETAESGERRPFALFVGSHRRDFETLTGVVELAGRLEPALRFVLVTDAAAGEALRARPNVQVLNNVAEGDLIQLYRTAAVVLQPMMESTANNSILEALACGSPVVATDIGGVRDYVTETNAVLTPPGDAAGMADAVIAIVRDEATRRRMGEAARRQALTFAWPEVVARLRSIYQGIL